jgi:tetratricopeptide (TPR) repeat protein
MKSYLLLSTSMILLVSQVGFAQSTGSNPDGTPLNALQTYYVGRGLEAQNRMEEAMPYYNTAIRMCLDEISQKKATPNSYVTLTWTLQRQQKYAEVITWGERGLRANADNYRLMEVMGEAYFYLDDYERSLSSMQRYIASLPAGDRISVAYFFIGEIYRLRGRFRHADIAYTTAVQLEPNLPLWWYRLGLARESAGEYAPAIEAYERALKLNPHYREANAGLERSRRGNT